MARQGTHYTVQDSKIVWERDGKSERERESEKVDGRQISDRQITERERGRHKKLPSRR